MTTKFKLLQNLPFAEAGTIFEKSTSTLWNGGSLSEAQDEILWSIKNNPAWFEPVLETPKPVARHRNGSLVFALKTGSEYYCIYVDGDIINQRWDNDNNDLQCLSIHNVFLTEQEAQKAIDNRKIYNKLYAKVKEIDAENEFEVKWGRHGSNDYNWYIYKSHHKHRNQEESPYTGNFHTSESEQSGQQYMSEQSAFYLLSDQVTDAEREVWINF